MTPQDITTSDRCFPPEPPSQLDAVSSLVRLANWRDGSAAIAIVAAALLPFANAWHVSYLVALTTSLIAAGLIAVACHAVRQSRIRTLALHPNLRRSHSSHDIADGWSPSATAGARLLPAPCGPPDPAARPLR